MAASVNKTAIEQADSMLQDLPEKPREVWSLREAVEALRDSIVEALNRGYSHEEVSKMLSEKGVEITPSSLKYYLSATRKDKDASTKQRRKPRGQGKKITDSSEKVNLKLKASKTAKEDAKSQAPVPEVVAPTAKEVASVEPEAAPTKKRTTRTTTGRTRTQTAAKAKPKSTSTTKTTPRGTATKGRGKKEA